jgi:hypothetical protein
LKDLGIDGWMILRRIFDVGYDWIHLAQDMDDVCCQHGEEPSGSIKYGEFLSSRATISFSRRIPLCGVSLFCVKSL